MGKDAAYISLLFSSRILHKLYVNKSMRDTVLAEAVLEKDYEDGTVQAYKLALESLEKYGLVKKGYIKYSLTAKGLDYIENSPIL